MLAERRFSLQKSFQGLAAEVQLGFRSLVCGGRGLEVSACPGCCRSSRRLSCRRRSRLAAEVATCCRSSRRVGCWRRSRLALEVCHSSRRVGCRRRSRLAAEVQLSAELQLAEEVLVRRGGPEAGRPEVGVCFRRRFVGGRQGPARRGA